MLLLFYATLMLTHSTSSDLTPTDLLDRFASFVRLDTANGKQAMEIMQRLNKETGTAFIFATHDPRVMAFARRVVKLQDGRVVDNGSGKNS